MLLITLRGLNVDKHKTRLLKSLTIIMQHFSDYSPRDALHKANKVHDGGLPLPWQRTTGHPVCEMHEHLRINLFLVCSFLGTGGAALAGSGGGWAGGSPGDAPSAWQRGRSRAPPGSASHGGGTWPDGALGEMLLACFGLHKGMNKKKFSPKSRCYWACQSAVQEIIWGENWNKCSCPHHSLLDCAWAMQNPGEGSFHCLPEQLPSAPALGSLASRQHPCKCAGFLSSHLPPSLPPLWHTMVQISCPALGTVLATGCECRACPTALHQVFGRTVGGTLCMSYHQLMDAVSVLMKYWRWNAALIC